MTYRLNRSHILISILAGVILAGGFVWHQLFGLPFSPFAFAFWVASALVLFYCLGHMVRSVLINDVFTPILDDYDLSEDEEYKAYLASLEATDSLDGELMLNDPLPLQPYDETLQDPLLELEPLQPQEEIALHE